MKIFSIKLDCVAKTSDDAVYCTSGDRSGRVCHAAAVKLAVGLVRFTIGNCI